MISISQNTLWLCEKRMMKSNNFTVANKRLTGSSYVPGK